MRRIGFLGCGKIGNALLNEALQMKDIEVVFVQDPVYNKQFEDIRIIREADEELYARTDLIIECAVASVLKENIAVILKHSDLMMFSVTAFSDEKFEKEAKKLCDKYDRKIYIPHGAILGLDGIFDGKKIWEKITVETTKNPHSLGRDDREKTILYEGSTREACRLYPRNVNVHAAIAMAGIGFDQTISKIVADPSVSTNSHIISMEGEGVVMQIQVSSFSTGGVTGKYTPYSAVGSLRRILENYSGLHFV